MKIVDFVKKGQSVRFYLGPDDLMDWNGDDWDDAPYEHNAGRVYDEFVTGYVDVTWPFGDLVMEPCDDWRNGGNSAWSKDDMKTRMVPCIIVIPESITRCGINGDNEFSFFLGNDAARKIYFGDRIEAMGTMGGAISIIKGEEHEEI